MEPYVTMAGTTLPQEDFPHLPADVKAVLAQYSAECADGEITPWEPGAPADFGPDPWLSDLITSHLPVTEQ